MYWRGVATSWKGDVGRLGGFCLGGRGKCAGGGGREVTFLGDV